VTGAGVVVVVGAILKNRIIEQIMTWYFDRLKLKTTPNIENKTHD